MRIKNHIEMENSNDWKPGISFIGKHVSLIPLKIEHEADLVEAVKDGELWKLWFTRVPSPEGMNAEIVRRLNLAEKGTMMPFTVLDKENRIVGMTSYQLLDSNNKRVEIGYTWYAKRVQKTALNTEAKYLLLKYAFEKLDCIAVGFTTSTFNEASRKAIERLGAKLDGILRNHSIIVDGIIRDTCYYSIINQEWAAVKRNLEWRLEQFTLDNQITK